jgi:hypothetical protein
LLFDKWIWAPSTSGIFSVKLAREVSLSSSGHVSPLSSKAWHKLWGLKIQARLKHLLLKVAWDSLPSQGNIGCFVPSVDIDAWVSLPDLFQIRSLLFYFLLRCWPFPSK